MKKTMILTLGIALFTGSMMFFSDASRTVYHQYLKQQIEQPTSGFSMPGYRPVSQSRVRESVPVGSTEAPKNAKTQIPNLRYPTDKRNVYSHQRDYTMTNLPRRVSTNRIGAFRNRGAYGLTRTSYNPANASGVASAEFVTYENETFSFQLPAAWAPESNGSHIFMDNRGELVVRVIRFDNRTCGRKQSFADCARDLNTTENGRLGGKEYSIGAGRIVMTSGVNTSGQFQDTVLNQRIQTNTQTIGFTAITPTDQAEKFFARHFVAGLDREVYMIETVVPISAAAENMGTIKAIFDSFRQYGQ